MYREISSSPEMYVSQGRVVWWESTSTCEGNEAFFVGANQRLPWCIEDVGREARGKGELMCWISESMNGGALDATVGRT